MTTSSTIEALGAHGSALVALAGDLKAAHGVQWAVPPRLDARSDVRSTGISDPTARTALNEHRLRVRGAIIEAESVLAVSADAFGAASAQLRAAVARWQSDL